MLQLLYLPTFLLLLFMLQLLYLPIFLCYYSCYSCYIYQYFYVIIYVTTVHYFVTRQQHIYFHGKFSTFFCFSCNQLVKSRKIIDDWRCVFPFFLVSEHSEEGLIFYAVISQYYTMFLQHIRIIVTDGRHEPAGPQLSDSAALLLCYTVQYTFHD